MSVKTSLVNFRNVYVPYKQRLTKRDYKMSALAFHFWRLKNHKVVLVCGNDTKCHEWSFATELIVWNKPKSNWTFPLLLLKEHLAQLPFGSAYKNKS